jgi:hypothetical protein
MSVAPPGPPTKRIASAATLPLSLAASETVGVFSGSKL